MSKEYKPHITEQKRKEVEDVQRLFNEYPVVGIVNLENLPTMQLQKIKKSIKETAVLKHTKKRLMKLAFDALGDKKNIQDLKEKLKGVPALLFTKEDPFSLFAVLKKSQSPAPAKPGQEAPSDLTLPAGPTSFAPGPMIGELGALGIKTEIKEGKIHVAEDTVLVKEGEVIKPKVAELLTKVGIEPMKIGLNLIYTYQDGEILDKSVLDLNVDEYVDKIKLAHGEAFNVAIFTAYPTAETVELLVQKASREVKAVAKKADILTSETAGEKVSEAERAAEAVKAQLPDMPEPAEAPKEEQPKESKQEAPAEEKKEETTETPEVKEEPKEEEKVEQPTEQQEEQPAPAEQPTPEPVAEQPVEKPTEEPVAETPTPEPEQPEVPKEESVEQSQEEAVEQPKEEPAPEPEQKEAVTNAPESIKTDEQVAQEVLKTLTEGKIKKEAANTPRSTPVATDMSQSSMDQLINNLKDKKSSGENK